MGAFHFFKIVQMVPNRSKHGIWKVLFFLQDEYGNTATELVPLVKPTLPQTVFPQYSWQCVVYTGNKFHLRCFTGSWIRLYLFYCKWKTLTRSNNRFLTKFWIKKADHQFILIFSRLITYLYKFYRNKNVYNNKTWKCFKTFLPLDSESTITLDLIR